MTRFDHIKKILDTAVGGQNIHAHGAFWRGLTRDQFVTKTVFGEQLLIIGDGAGSNLVKALKGEPPFGADTGNPDADYNRMPSGMPEVLAPDIAFIQQWIGEGCLEDEWPPASPEAEEEDNSKLHITYWREFDNRTLFNPTPEVQNAIEAVMPKMGVWRKLAKGHTKVADWVAAITPIAAELTVLHNLQHDSVTEFYSSPVLRGLFFESYQEFGANTLPDDPLRPADPRHTMNGSTMWFIWSAFSDACLRLGLESEFLDAQMRALMIGAANDGLFRRRFSVNGFPATKDGQVQLLNYWANLPAADLPQELIQRYLDSGL